MASYLCLMVATVLSHPIFFILFNMSKYSIEVHIVLKCMALLFPAPLYVYFVVKWEYNVDTLSFQMPDTVIYSWLFFFLFVFLTVVLSPM